MSVAGNSQQDVGEQMKAAEKRWERQVREGRVKNLSCTQAGQLIQNEGWKLLDVRPIEEVSKAAVDGAVNIPIFVVEDAVSPNAFLKKASAFGMGGWWLGGTHMKPNMGFLREVEQKIPKDSRVIVACQKGLRSLAACEQLSKAGYQEVAWINGGFDTAQKDDLPVANASDLRFGGIGGLSEFLGWTDVQRQNNSSEGFLGGFQNVLKLAAIVLLLDGLWFGYDVANFWIHKN